ncbi:phosphoribosyltransferase family protein [Altericroceibacterium xinjiangense]|uniref:phosphoribosyltransferase family protein n=1 Tax=Altericroceibacterium xinjiangense TaxID=762261 RepID=UPI000F7DE76C|nr:phosphoribosyltransferase family protein [Altericroceibacterium xinjiangense]
MNFRSISDLNADIVANLHRIPSDVDVVVGIPRSGMLPASIIALARNLPLAEVRGFAEGRLLSSGSTRVAARSSIGFEEVRHALIVDDSTHTGTSLNEARALLAPLAKQMKLTFCAIYSAHASHPEADVTFVHLPQPRVFEWNVMHHAVLSQACVDIDGVLCLDPTDEQNDDADRYLNFLREATPRPIPSRRIAALVTSRLEKYRPETEAWLAAKGIEYERLVMLDLPSAEERRRLGAHGTFKGEYYRKSNATLFIESELRQAEEIARISGKPVLSIEGSVMCYPGLSPLALLQKARSAHPGKKLVGVAKRMLGAQRYKRARALLGP